MVFHHFPLAAIAIVLVATGCASYVPGRQAYWDGQVKEMCDKGGHVEIYEPVLITKKVAQRIRGLDGTLTLTTKDLAQVDDPIYMESQETIIREGSPRIRRTDWAVVRRADGKVVARWSSFGRIGGDFPSPAHDSSFKCPDWKQTWSEMESLFVVSER